MKPDLSDVAKQAPRAVRIARRAQQLKTLNKTPKVIDRTPEERAVFLQKTYLHLAGALAIFIALEALLLNSPWVETYATFFRESRETGLWAGIIIAFMFVSRYARQASRNYETVWKQYAFFAVFVAIKALLILPLLWRAETLAPGTILSSAIITAFLGLGLSIFALTTKRDLSFLRAVTVVGGLVIAGIALASWLLGFQLGLVLAGIIALYAAVTIVYRTNQIIQSYKPDQYIVAAIGLFASVTMLFASIVRLQTKSAKRQQRQARAQQPVKRNNKPR